MRVGDEGDVVGGVAPPTTSSGDSAELNVRRSGGCCRRLRSAGLRPRVSSGPVTRRPPSCSVIGGSVDDPIGDLGAVGEVDQLDGEVAAHLHAEYGVDGVDVGDLELAAEHERHPRHQAISG